jgi:hypothetical protein
MHTVNLKSFAKKLDKIRVIIIIITGYRCLFLASINTGMLTDSIIIPTGWTLPFIATITGSAITN